MSDCKICQHNEATTKVFYDATGEVVDGCEKCWKWQDQIAWEQQQRDHADDYVRDWYYYRDMRLADLENAADPDLTF